MSTILQGVKQNPDLLKDDLRRISFSLNELTKYINRQYLEVKAIKTINNSYSLGDDASIILADASTGNLTITLQTASNLRENRLYNIKKIDNTSNTVTLSGQVDGSTAYVISTQYSNVTIANSSTQWWVL